MNGESANDLSKAAVDTVLYGQVSISYTDRDISAEYDTGPPTAVTIRRIGTRTHPRTPLGTRESDRVRAEVNGAVMTLTPRPTRLWKSSYSVGLEVKGARFGLVAKDLETSRFVSGHRNDGDNSFGELTRTADGSIDVLWAVPFTFLKKTVEPPLPSRDQAIIAIAVAAAFGTGGLSATTIAVGILGSSSLRKKVDKER